MKGLILNDLFSLRSYLKSLLLMIVIFGVVWGVRGESSFFIPFISALIAISAINIFSYDEYYHWDSFPVTMPVTRKQIVVSRYLTFLILILTGMVIGTAFSVVCALIYGEVNLGEILVSQLFAFLIPAFIASFSVPLCYKFGTQKMRLFLVGIFLVPSFIIGMGAKFLNLTQSSIQTILSMLVWLLPVLVLALLGVSVLVSISIYQKKQF